jgi:hypothetical protein
MIDNHGTLVIQTGMINLMIIVLDIVEVEILQMVVYQTIQIRIQIGMADEHYVDVRTLLPITE